jgi:tetratricopeptide (TPR) repeat protein
LESPNPAAQERGRQRLAQSSALAREQGQQVPFGANVAALCHNLGGAYERAGAPDRAIVVYRRALEMNPNPSASTRRLGNAFRQLAQDLTARAEYVAALAAMDSAQKYTGSVDLLAF